MENGLSGDGMGADRIASRMALGRCMGFRYFFSNADRPVTPKIRVVTPVILLVGALMLFGAVLLTSQRYADGDEAVVGMMAKHVLTKGEHPIFYYGQPYGGGGAIEAYLAVIPFVLFGVSTISLKSVALFIWLVTIALCYGFCLRHYNYLTALSAAVILITATPLIEWHLKMRGGYAAVPMFFMMILMLFSYLGGEKSQRGLPYLLFGLLCGVAYYNLELIFSLLATVLVFSFCRRHIFWKWKPAFLTIAGFIIGTGPLLIFNLTHGFANVKHVFGAATGHGGSNPFFHFYKLVTSYLPRFFVGRNVDQYIREPSILAYAEYAVYLLLLGYVSIKIWPQFLRLAKSLVSPAGAERKKSPLDIEAFLVLYLIVHCIMYSISRNTDSPRYLLPLYPALAIVAARGGNRLLMEQKRVLGFAGLFLLGALIFCGSINHLAYMGPSRVNDDVFIRGKGRVNFMTSGDTVSAIIGYLKKRGISRVWCTYFVQWRLIFESNEELIASSDQLSPGARRYPLYDEMVREFRGPVAIVLHRKDSLLPFLLAPPMKGYQKRVIGEYVALTPGEDPKERPNHRPKKPDAFNG